MMHPKPWWVLVGGLAMMLVLLAGAKALTKNRIAETKKKEFNSTLQELVANADGITRFDNDPLEDIILATSPLLGNTDSLHRLFRLRQQNQPVAVLIESITPDGYNGDIELIVAIGADSEQVLGVRVTKHRETPGLGDDIEINRSNWITQFDGQALSNIAEGAWAVQKDGGQFDQLTGATITARAVIHSVESTLLWYAEHKQLVFAVEPGTHLQ